MDFDTDFPSALAHLRPDTASEKRHPRVGYADPERHRVEIALAFPLEIDGQRLDRLTVRRPTAADVVRVVEEQPEGLDDAELIRRLIAAMIDQPIEVLDALWPDDGGRVAEAALPFLPARFAAALEAMDAGAAEPG